MGGKGGNYLAITPTRGSLLPFYSTPLGPFLPPVVPVLHYFPALVCLTSIKATKDPLGSKMIAAAAPAVLFNVYTRVLDPSDVYGVPIQPAVAAGIGTAYGVLAALAVWYTERGSRI